MKPCSAWAVLWTSESKRDGKKQFIINSLLISSLTGLAPALFDTRKRAKAWIDKEFGYIRTRPDLKAEPHGWRMPKPVRVTIALAQKGKKSTTHGMVRWPDE